MLKKLIELNIDDLWLYAAVEGGLFLLAQIVIGAAMVLTGENSSVAIMGVLLPIVAAILLLVAGIGHVTILFEQAIQFGQTRRRALGLIVGLIAFQGAFAMGLAAVLAGVERFLCPYLWAALAGKSGWVLAQAAPVPEGQAESLAALQQASGLLYVDAFTLDWWWWLLALGVGMAGGIIIGAVAQRYGSRGLWCIWGVWMLATFGPQLLGGNAMGIGDRGMWMVPAAALAVAVGLAWSVWSLLHAVVKH